MNSVYKDTFYLTYIQDMILLNTFVGHRSLILIRQSMFTMKTLYLLEKMGRLLHIIILMKLTWISTIQIVFMGEERHNLMSSGGNDLVTYRVIGQVNKLLKKA